MAFFLFYLRPRTVATIRASTATPSTLAVCVGVAAAAIDIAVANADANAICVRLLHHSTAVAVAVVAGVRRVCFGLGAVCGTRGMRNEERGTGAGFACEGEMHNLRAHSRAAYCALCKLSTRHG